MQSRVFRSMMCLGLLGLTACANQAGGSNQGQPLINPTPTPTPSQAVYTLVVQGLDGAVTVAIDDHPTQFREFTANGSYDIDDLVSNVTSPRISVTQQPSPLTCWFEDILTSGYFLSTGITHLVCHN